MIDHLHAFPVRLNRPPTDQDMSWKYSNMNSLDFLAKKAIVGTLIYSRDQDQTELIVHYGLWFRLPIFIFGFLNKTEFVCFYLSLTYLAPAVVLMI